MESESVRVRSLDILDWDVEIEGKANGCFYVRPLAALGEYPHRLTDRLDECAARHPARTFLADGFLFDGRITEDFKLSTGTWVSVGPLRTSMLLHFGGLVSDIVIAGHDRDELTALIFPDENAFSNSGEAAGDGADSASTIRARFHALLNSFAQLSTGSSNRVVRAIVVNEPPSLDSGEVTDKGSLNQAAVLNRRAALVEDLYRVPCPANVIEIDARYRQT
jgi:feruloyl-CoA synthase